MTCLLDDEDYDSKYIAIESSSGTKIYDVFRLIAELKDTVGMSTGVNPREIELDDDYFEDFGLTDSEMEDLADECNEKILRNYKIIPKSEAWMWQTLYDTMASIVRSLGEDAKGLEVPAFSPNILNMKEEYVSFEDGRRKNYHVRIYHVRHVARDVKSIIHDVTGIPINKISLEMDYKNDLHFGFDKFFYLWTECNDLLASNEGIPYRAIKKWTTVHDTTDSVVKAMHDRKRFEVPAKVRY